jgi:hypothetical protein
VVPRTQTRPGAVAQKIKTAHIERTLHSSPPSTRARPDRDAAVRSARRVVEPDALSANRRSASRGHAPAVTWNIFEDPQAHY